MWLVLAVCNNLSSAAAVVCFFCFAWKKMADFWVHLHSPLSSLQAYYFDRDDQALHNFAKFFRNQSHEEREHAEKLMKMQNQRGGRIFLQDVRVQAHVYLTNYFFNVCVLTWVLAWVWDFLFRAIIRPLSGGQHTNKKIRRVWVHCAAYLSPTHKHNPFNVWVKR